MPISIENNLETPDRITSLADQARGASLREFDPEKALTERISADEALNLARSQVRIKGLLFEDEIVNLATDGKTDFEIIRPIHSVSEGLEAFEKYAKVFKSKIDNKISQGGVNNETGRNIVLSRALNASVFLKYVEGLTEDPDVYKSLKDHVDLVTDFLIVADSDTLNLKTTDESKCDVVGEFTEYGLSNPAELEVVFDSIRRLAPKSPEYAKIAENYISGIKAEVITAFLISKIETNAPLTVSKAPVSRDFRESTDLIISEKSEDGETPVELLLIDIKKAKNSYCEGVCLLHPISANEFVATRGGSALGISGAENLGFDDKITKAVTKRLVPALVVRVPPELVAKTQLGDLSDPKFLEYNELLPSIAEEINLVLKEVERKRKA